MMLRKDELGIPDDLYFVRKKVYIAAPIEQVFEAITDAEHWNRFFTTGMELDPRPGGVCHFRWENWGPDLIKHESPGHVVEIEAPDKFVFEWGRPGLETLARFSLSNRGEGTVLELFEDGYPKSREGLQSILECSAHWGELLMLIKFYVESGLIYRAPSPDSNGAKVA